jgi:hypothetical protein
VFVPDLVADSAHFQHSGRPYHDSLAGLDIYDHSGGIVHIHHIALLQALSLLQEPQRYFAATGGTPPLYAAAGLIPFQLQQIGLAVADINIAKDVFDDHQHKFEV